MKLTKKQIKERYFKKVYDAAPIIECACGCGTKIKTKDKYGRDKRYVSGHNTRKYDDPTEYKRAWNHRNRAKRFAYRTKRNHRIKSDLIVKAGGKCMICGIPFTGDCISMFDFHHRDALKRKFSVSCAAINRYSLVDIREEAKKCDLLCANCHRLIHWEWKDENVEE